MKKQTVLLASLFCASFGLAYADGDKCAKQVNEELTRLGMGSLGRPSGCYNTGTNKSPLTNEPQQYFEPPGFHSKDFFRVSGAEKSAYYLPQTMNNQGDAQLTVYLNDLLLGEGQEEIIKYDSHCKVKSVEVKRSYGFNRKAETVLYVEAKECDRYKDIKGTEIFDVASNSWRFCKTYDFAEPSPTAGSGQSQNTQKPQGAKANATK